MARRVSDEHLDALPSREGSGPERPGSHGSVLSTSPYRKKAQDEALLKNAPLNLQRHGTFEKLDFASRQQFDTQAKVAIAAVN